MPGRVQKALVALVFAAAALPAFCWARRLSQSPVAHCPQLPAHVPRDVRDLTPANVGVMMALGDSITAAFGAMGKSGGLDEFRGVSGVIGGNPGATSLCGFFTHFNSSLQGCSIGEHLVELPGEGYYPNDVLNAAQSGATTTDFPHQIAHLVAQVHANPKISLASDWKILNILIGANDACPLCYAEHRPTIQEAADTYEKNLEVTLQSLQAHFPRTFVNILPLFNVSNVYYLSQKSEYCELFHDLVPWECPCVFDSDSANRRFLDDIIAAYGERVVKITERWQGKKIDDFWVTYQPFTRSLNLTDMPLDFISTLDCFHPSVFAHQQMSVAGWNSVLTPAASKPEDFKLHETLRCPTATDRLS